MAGDISIQYTEYSLYKEQGKLDTRVANILTAMRTNTVKKKITKVYTEVNFTQRSWDFRRENEDRNRGS